MEDSKAIPFPDVVDVVAKLPYASCLRVMFEMLALTGCRIASLDRMKVSQIHEGRIYWHEGKKTTGLRKEHLPAWYWAEIEEYRRRDGIVGDRLFGINAENFVKRFRHDVRPLVGRRWASMHPEFYASGPRQEYDLQLKGLRKNFQTLEFARQLARWKDANVALEFTSKRMRHSSARITAYHYIQNFESIDATRFQDQNMGQILNDGHSQQSIFDYDDRSSPRRHPRS